MAPSSCLFIIITLFFFFFFAHIQAGFEDHADGDRQIYIVYMGECRTGTFSTQASHFSVLEQVLHGRTAKESMVYSYRKSFNGFAAKLTHQEQQNIASMDGIVSVFPSKTLKLHTTRSWDFLGFTSNVKRKPAIESNVIIGVIDTGIWPESESFNEEGLGPPPSKWKGTCQNFICTNKIIGAQFYYFGNSSMEELSPRDTAGHGTHTASTVAGVEVMSASLFGLAKGTARGAMPLARIAVYKVCWLSGCADHDILAAFDDAIDDGVDIISISIGGGVQEYFKDAVAIGSFHAMKKGILTSSSAGNKGPDLGSISNLAPWMLTVAASSTDRRITAEVALGNHKTLMGSAVNTFPTQKRFLPLIYGGHAGSNAQNAKYCDDGFLNETLVKGKIVLCDKISIGDGPYHAGARGTIMTDTSDIDVSYSFPLPTTCLSKADGDKVRKYVNKTRNPVAIIYKSKAVFDPKAPTVGSFSSRGPNLITPDILKPDISAPGVEILAAWSPKSPISSSKNGKRFANYNIMSGTSMACPHATGAAAYIKSFHPSWSPSAIKSAIMTTAVPLNITNNKDAEFAYGAGQLNPLKAVHPGLVYDAQEGDYIEMLCNQGYDSKKIKLISGENVSCPKASNKTVRDLNYPSMAAKVEKMKPFSKTFTRVVTNVGLANSTYKAIVSIYSDFKILVTPSILSFESLKEKHQFVVEVSGKALPAYSIISASLTWSDGKHNVRSPIVIYPDLIL